MENYYKTLEIEMNASQAQIKTAYRKLAMRFHPDRNSDSKESEEKFKQLSEAYKTLINKSKRRIYDLRLNRQLENIRSEVNSKESKLEVKVSPITYNVVELKTNKVELKVSKVKLKHVKLKVDHISLNVENFKNL